MKDFKSYCEELIDQYDKREIMFSEITNTICKEFQIKPHLFRRRFKSIFGKSLGEVCRCMTLPNKEHFTCMVLASNSVKELWEKVKVSNGKRKNIFEKFYGVSTFERAKAKLLSYKPYVDYTPTIADNESIAISQFFGDGSWSKDRCCFRISHGEKQFEYAVFKAGLFNKAWPTTKPAGETKLLTHIQGHKYSSWYSGRLPDKISKMLSTDAPEDLVDKLTTFGVFLWCMDDGYCNFNLTLNQNSYFEIYIHNQEVCTRFREYLRQFGIDSSLSGQYLGIKSLENAVNFHKIFIQPFAHMLPDCMLYKTKLKI